MVSETSTPVPARRGLRSFPAYCRKTGSAIASGLADLIIPPACLACREQIADHDALCAGCWQNVQFIRAPVCNRLGLPMPFDTGGTIISAAAAANPPNYDHARAVGHFSGIMRDLILSFKYADSHHARKLFGRWLSSAGVELINDCDIIAPVPMHPFRLLNRRFNQSAILAKEVAKTNNRRYEPMILNRVRQTQSQVGLSSDQRRRNLAGAFALTARQKTRVKNCNILLIDDVITTGTTLNACARALRRAGAARVDALALAIVTHDSQITL